MEKLSDILGDKEMNFSLKATAGPVDPVEDGCESGVCSDNIGASPCVGESACTSGVVVKASLNEEKAGGYCKGDTPSCSEVACSEKSGGDTCGTATCSSKR